MTTAAFIGAGSRSVSHMTALSQIADTRVVGVADLDESRAHAALERANGRRADGSAAIAPAIFSDFRRMVEETDPDCIYLCLPPHVHGLLDHQVIDFGKPVLFEKPVANQMSVALEIADHVRSSGIVNGAGYQKRYSSAVRRAVQLLEGVPIGMAISIRLSGLPGQPWWRVQSQGGGMLIEQHTHAVDLMRVLCGEVESAYAVGNTNLLAAVPNLDIFDVNACTLRFASGAPGIIGNSCAAPAGAPIFPPHLVHVVARDMVLSVNEKKTVIHRSGQDETEEILMEENDDLLMNRAFIEGVRSNSQAGILCDYEEGMRTLAVTLACQQSAEAGQLVQVDSLL